MDPAVPVKTSFDREKVIRELILGRDSVTQLRGVIRSPAGVGGLVKSSEVLVGKILGSLDAALAILSSEGGSEECPDPVSTELSSACSGYQMSHESGKANEALGCKRRRGGSKRRKTSGTWMRVSASPFEDGHAWRKYGQKEILGAKFPRSYFRCTHRNEQGCSATKQVQKTDDNPSMFCVTYSGKHTCRDLLKVSDPDNGFVSSPNRSYYLNFESGSKNVNQGHPFSSFAFSKQEDSEEVFSDLILNHLPEDLQLPELLSCATTAGPSTAASDGSDMFSGMCSSSSSAFDVDMMVGTDDIDNVFRFGDEFY